MKNFLVLFSVMTLVVSSAFSQKNDAQLYDKSAATLLQNVSKKYQSYKDVSISFQMISDIPDTDEDVVKSGTLAMRGKAFNLKIGSLQSVSDGKTLWNYLRESNQVQISDYENDDETFTPEDFFQLYKNGYLYRIKETKTVNGKKITVIEMSPEDKDVSFFKIEVSIATDSNELIAFKIFEKNGVHTSYKLDSIKVNQNLADSTFIFYPEKYANIDVVDVR